MDKFWIGFAVNDKGGLLTNQNSGAKPFYAETHEWAQNYLSKTPTAHEVVILEAHQLVHRKPMPIETVRLEPAPATLGDILGQARKNPSSETHPHRDHPDF